MQDSDPEEDAITGINVTPLVDITLVLLIIFMVTARFISEPSIGVNLPKSSNSAANPADRNVYLTVDDKHQVFLNSAPISKNEVSEKIKQLLKEKPDMNLVLRADKSVSHGEVIALLDQVRSQGVTQFGIAVEGQ